MGGCARSRIGCGGRRDQHRNGPPRSDRRLDDRLDGRRGGRLDSRWTGRHGDRQAGRWGSRAAVGRLPRLLLGCVLAVCLQCGHDAGLGPEQAWQRAQQAAGRPDLAAGFVEWQGLDPGSPQGQKAQGRLAQAAAQYRQALQLLQSGQPGAREALRRGKALAPMDPQLFLPLARALRAQENDDLAAQFYRGFLRHLPTSPDAVTARAELEQLERDRAPQPDDPALSQGGLRFTPLGLGLLVALSVAGLAIGLFLARNRRGQGLAAIMQQHPELQPALAYALGTLRHELLKHRIGTATQLQARSAPLSDDDLRFLCRQLYGGGEGEREGRGDQAVGKGLRDAWDDHVRRVARVVGCAPAQLLREPGFARAQQAITQLLRCEPAVRRGQRSVLRRVAGAEATLRSFDAQLATLLARMQRTELSVELFQQALSAVQSEAAVADVVLDDLQLVAPQGDLRIVVAVYQTDMLLVLRNLLRNALRALSNSPPPRRLAVDVLSELLPTGEELVRLRVHDSALGSIPEDRLRGTAAQPQGPRGLDLVRMTVQVYGGSLAVEKGLPGYRKCVVVRLFRLLDDEPNDVSNNASNDASSDTSNDTSNGASLDESKDAAGESVGRTASREGPVAAVDSPAAGRTRDRHA